MSQNASQSVTGGKCLEIIGELVIVMMMWPDWSVAICRCGQSRA
jgi:hypothetical protein